MDNIRTPSTFLGSADGLVGSGIMGALVRAKDWSKTPLGPPSSWPQSLKTAISTCLNCSFPILIWWGSDLIKIYNDAYRPIIGNKHPDALGQKGELVWGEIWHVIGPMLHRVLEYGEASQANDMQLMLERRGYPEECYFSFSYSPIYDETGGVGGVFCPVMETTEQVIGARRLETLRRLAALPHAERVSDACVQACEVLAGNGADVPFALVYLLSGDQARLVASAGIVPDGPYSPIQIDLTADGAWPLGRALAQPMVIDSGGRTFPSGVWSKAPREAYLAPILLPGSDEAAGVMIVGINPHKKIDQSYRSFLDLLASQMASRIADAVAYEAERKRAEALAELDRAKTAFFSNISHEFRTPLTLVLGPLEDMLRETTGGTQEQLEVVHRNALRLLKLVNTLLNFVRIEAGRAKASFEPTDLAEFTKDLAGVFSSAIERAGLRLVVDCPALPQPVYVDREMWETIVLNLLSNALKFTFDGEIAVILKQRGQTVELSVADTGIGVPADDLPRIFERFHRVEGARGRTHEGSGIGLALVRELVRLHDGDITVESIEGSGTTFRVSIPVRASATDRGAQAGPAAPVGADVFIAEALLWLPNAGREFDPPHPALMETGRAAQTPSARVLVADDNADMRDYLKRLLAGRYTVVTAADGQAALEAARETKPDLILSDVMMPRLDGFGLLHHIREDDTLRDTPVVLLSARAGEEAKIEGLESGADDYLIKPFSARELLARVDSHLKLRRLRSESDERFRALVHASAQIVWATGPDGEVEEDLPLWRAFTGQTYAEMRGWGWLNAVHPDDRAIVAEGGRRGIACGLAYESEFRVRHRTGDWRWMVARCVPLKRADGSISGWIGMNTDISDRKQAEQTQQLLINELNHRVKNTLASVQAIVHHTLRQTRDPDAFAASLTGRIQSLARVHTLLSSGSWKGAYLREIVRDQILIDPDDPVRVSIKGPLVRLEPQMALHMALMLHELATNSAKYGAFSTHTGQVGIEWTVEERKLHFTWSERGGPPVPPPTRRGFGTMLIEQSAKSAGGDAQARFAPDGVTWIIDLLLSARAALTAQPEAASRPGNLIDGTGDQHAAAIALAGKRFLVVEDEPLVILDLMGALEAVGAEVSSAGTTERGLSMIKAGRFDGALLDANLLGRPVDELAAALTRRRVPFVFITGYGRESLPSGYDCVTLLTKPVREDVLIAAAAKLVGQRP
jgi:PAS domain S-box-containing protein